MDAKIAFQVIQSNGIRLHTAVAGPADGPLTIFLHGFPDFWYGWRAQIPPLRQAGLRVLAPDLRGYNLSEKPAPISAYAVDTLAKDVAGLILASNQQSAFLIGHDWGGVLAWQVASTYPDLVDKLVVMNAPEWHTMARQLSTDATQMLRSWYILFFQLPRVPEALLRYRDFRLLSRIMAGRQTDGPWNGEDARAYRSAWSRPGALTAMLNWYRMAFRQGTAKLLTSPTLPRITAPTLVVWGQRDPALGPKLAQRSLERCLDGELVYFPDAGHWVHWDESERVNQMLVNFLDPD